MSVGRALWITVVLLASATAAHAQDESRLGISMGYPAAIGVHIPLSDTVTIRPAISFTGTSVTDTTIETSTWNLGLNVSALFYVHHDDRLRTYIAPTLEYGHGATNTSSSTILLPTTLDSDRDTWGGSGLFGAQYSLNDRFGLFGEFGFGASMTRLPATSGTDRPSAKSWGTRTAVGVIFFP